MQNINKKCAKCNLDKTFDNFYKSGKYYHSYCKECSKQVANDYNKNLPDYNERQKKYHSTDEYKKYQKEYQSNYKS